MEAKRILAYAEVLFRENDLSGTKWGALKGFVPLKTFSRDQMPKADNLRNFG